MLSLRFLDCVFISWRRKTGAYFVLTFSHVITYPFVLFVYNDCAHFIKSKSQNPLTYLKTREILIGLIFIVY